MNNYPSYPQAEGTKLVVRSGIRLRMASNGLVRARALQSVSFHDVVIVHKNLMLADVDIIKTFHENNRGVDVAVTLVPYGGLALTCVFDTPPYQEEPQLLSAGQALFTMTVNLKQSQ